ncbi:MAG: PEGA domain-containing protein [Archangiaceae bacterium]|nr:PEGA domain-containing protein [Archangiaceae bacterium]
MATPRGVTFSIAAGLLALPAHAGPRAIAIASGDCRAAELQTSATAFTDAVNGLLKGDAIDASALLERLRPRPSAGLDDVQRQLDGAQSQFYSGQLEQAVDMTRTAIKTLERLPPADEVTRQLISARVLAGLIYKAMGKRAEQLEVWKRVLRIAPDHQLDPDFHTPAAIAQFDALKKDLARQRKVPLNVSSTPAGATVFVDGARVGRTPLKEVAFVPGDYKVTLVEGAMQSFVYEVKLDSKPVELAIDFAFEGGVRGQLPLCVAGSEADALKLASRSNAEQALLLKVDARSADPWVSAVLFDVPRGARVREGGMKASAARQNHGWADLASFVLTGQPAKLALAGASSVGPSTEAPPPAAAEAVPAQAPEPPPTASASRSGSNAGRVVGGVIAGVGVVLGVSGIALYLSGGADRAALVGHVDAQGRVINPAEAQQVAVIDRRISNNRNASLGLGLAGAGVAVVGAVLFFVLAPSDAPQPTAFVGPNGAYAGLTGRF